MNIADLKKAFYAARIVKGHDKISEAADSMGYSETTINKFFQGELKYTSRVESAICEYVKGSGIISFIKKIGLEPD